MPSGNRGWVGGEVGTHSHMHNFQLNFLLSINLRIPLEGGVVAMAGRGRLAMVIGPEEMPTLVWGRRKHPPTKMGST